MSLQWTDKAVLDKLVGIGLMVHVGGDSYRTALGSTVNIWVAIGDNIDGEYTALLCDSLVRRLHKKGVTIEPHPDSGVFTVEHHALNETLSCEGIMASYGFPSDRCATFDTYDEAVIAAMMSSL